MKAQDFTILSNELLCKNVYRMVLAGDTSDIKRPGQFVNIALPGKFLRRPISICDWEENCLIIIYKVVGEGTDQMSQMVAGETLNLLVGLGNGFTLMQAKHPVLLGGGVGVPPLYGLAKKLLAAGQKPVMIMGFNTAEEVFYAEEFRQLGIEVRVTTMDGTMGTKGVVTDVLDDEIDYFYTCGPLPMLKAIQKTVKSAGQVSMEERMGCGFGACVGCTLETKNGPKRVCKDGPVFMKEDLL